MVRRQRIVKSPEELDYMREAASLTAAAMTAMLEGDGGMPPAGPLVNSGRRTVYERGVGGTRPLEAKIR
jgi:Xaa-Pro dipeptidase